MHVFEKYFISFVLCRFCYFFVLSLFPFWYHNCLSCDFEVTYGKKEIDCMYRNLIYKCFIYLFTTFIDLAWNRYDMPMWFWTCLGSKIRNLKGEVKRNLYGKSNTKTWEEWRNLCDVKCNDAYMMCNLTFEHFNSQKIYDYR